MSSLKDALETFGRTAGGYWSQNNAEFEQGDPTLLARAVRAINPMSGFGSAVGAMHDAASKGFPVADTTVALLQSLPTFGATKAVNTIGSGAIKSGSAISPDLLKTLLSFAVGTGASVGADAAQATPPNNPSIKR